MEKLIELLNEYIEENRPKTNLVKEITDDGYFVNNRNDGDGFLCETIMSKKFGFIKWLVDNDKIDKKKLDEAERRPMYVTDDMFSLYKIDECIIMLLAISENPIEDLISYLR